MRKVVVDICGMVSYSVTSRMTVEVPDNVSDDQVRDVLADKALTLEDIPTEWIVDETGDKVDDVDYIDDKSLWVADPFECEDSEPADKRVVWCNGGLDLAILPVEQNGEVNHE